LGPDKDPYRYFYRLRNHDRQDDYTSIILTVDIVGRIPGGTTEAEVESVIDVRQWLRAMAVRSTNADWDFIGTGSSKNCYAYWPPSRGQWHLLMWDCELAFQNATMDIYGVRVPQMRQFQLFQGFHHHFLNQIHEYMAKYFNHAFMDMWIDHYYATVGGYNPATLKQFITDRRNYVQGRLDPYLIPNVTINITTTDPLTVSTLTADLDGTAPVNASWVRCNGREYWLNWTDATHWYVTIDVPPGSNLLTLEFLDYDHQLIGTDTITVRAPLTASQVKAWKAY
jgi:hypothetical protein